MNYKGYKITYSTIKDPYSKKTLTKIRWYKNGKLLDEEIVSPELSGIQPSERAKRKIDYYNEQIGIHNYQVGKRQTYCSQFGDCFGVKQNKNGTWQVFKEKHKIGRGYFDHKIKALETKTGAIKLAKKLLKRQTEITHLIRWKE